VVDGVTYKLSLLPSGVVRPNKLSIIGNGVVIDPWALVEEIERIRQQGVTITPETLMIAENATLILPPHGRLDRAREAAQGSKAIGAPGRRIGPAYEATVGRRAVRVCDLADVGLLSDRLDVLLVHHNALLRGLAEEEIVKSDLLEQLLAVAPN